MKRMLFNATQEEELRVAIVDGQKLVDLDIEHAGKEQRKGNIYKGVITRIEPSLEAAFVNYGTDRYGFLPFKEIARSYFQEDADSRASIKEALREGLELIVQVDKDERGTKGAALTTFISLAGRYIVLMPNNPSGGGVSRRIEGEERNELRDTMAQLDVPAGMSIIARTAGIGRSLEELQWDFNYLLQLWNAIKNASTLQQGPFLIYQEGSLVIRAIRDYFQPDIGEILIDTPEIYDQALQFMNHVMPANVSRVKLYRDAIPLFSRFQIEHQIETAFAREVLLPSGGAIVIDHTEALVSIDVNSGRATKGRDIEETALRTNLEAAEETARQLRLRDIGGLVVIDFIDMESQRNQREVENRLREALRYDRARVQFGKISRFGLMELSRQRLRPSLGEGHHIPCPRCHGTGHIRGIESTALHILRITQEEAMKENSAVIQVQLPVEAATFLLNEKRAEIHSIEERMGIKVVLIPNIHLETPNYKITRLRHDDISEETSRASYELVELPSEIEQASAQQKPEAPKQVALVRGITPSIPAPTQAEPATERQPASSLFGRFRNWLARISSSSKQEEAVAAPQPSKREGGRRRTERSREVRQEARAKQYPAAHRRQEPRQASAMAEKAAPEQAVSEIQSQLEIATQPAAVSKEDSEIRGSRRRGRRERKPRSEFAAAAKTALQPAQPETAEPATPPVLVPLTEMQAPIVEQPAPVGSPLSEAAHIADSAPFVLLQETPEAAASAAEAAQMGSAADTAATAQEQEKTARHRRKARHKTGAETTQAPLIPDIAESGLTLVETRPDAIGAEIAATAEPTPRGRLKTAPWQRQVHTETPEEPLVMVETRK